MQNQRFCLSLRESRGASSCYAPSHSSSIWRRKRFLVPNQLCSINLKLITALHSQRQALRPLIATHTLGQNLVESSHAIRFTGWSGAVQKSKLVHPSNAGIPSQEDVVLPNLYFALRTVAIVADSCVHGATLLGGVFGNHGCRGVLVSAAVHCEWKGHILRRWLWGVWHSVWVFWHNIWLMNLQWWVLAVVHAELESVVYGYSPATLSRTIIEAEVHDSIKCSLAQWFWEILSSGVLLRTSNVIPSNCCVNRISSNSPFLLNPAGLSQESAMRPKPLSNIWSNAGSCDGMAAPGTAIKQSRANRNSGSCATLKLSNAPKRIHCRKRDILGRIWVGELRG